MIDTRQIFLDRDRPNAVGLHVVLSPWHVRGRYLPPPLPLRFLYGLIGHDWTMNAKRLPPKIKPKLALVAQLAKLPPDQAMKHWQRLAANGAI